MLASIPPSAACQRVARPPFQLMASSGDRVRLSTAPSPITSSWVERRDMRSELARSARSTPVKVR